MRLPKRAEAKETVWSRKAGGEGVSTFADFGNIRLT
jgi:hypothetical protein